MFGRSQTHINVKDFRIRKREKSNCYIKIIYDLIDNTDDF